MSPSQYVKIDASVDQFSNNLPANILDTDGDAIRNNQAYSIQVLSLPNDENYRESLSTTSNISLASSPYVEVRTLTTKTGEAMSYHPDGFLIFPSEKETQLKFQSITLWQKHSILGIHGL